ncbi:hypothetical protein [Ignavibacterium sp.]|uniref:hypothetical protein n=1 Tax=Ignavibacterium sp. TaxID=2651167 RepID=UPI00307F977F
MNRYLFALFVFVILSSCKEEIKETVSVNYKEKVELSAEKDASIQMYNLERIKTETTNRFPCDTISVIEHIIKNFPSGTYLLRFDKTSVYDIPKPAVIYYDTNEGKFVFAVIARSKPGERFIEPSNIVGYYQSFIDLDSTKLGTPFIYLVLFECKGEQLFTVWEAPIPSHGGFNNFAVKNWSPKAVTYVEVNFHYGQGAGNINYNYFLVDGIRNQPHLLMTYDGIDFRRTLANINDDKFPDYYEHIFYSLPDRVIHKDSVAFIFNQKDSLYYSTEGRKITRRY